MRVGIIGGGLAGLACAYRLKQRGIESVVFEASDTARGRARAERHDGFTLDVGAQYLLGPEVFHATFELIRNLGLADDLVSIPPIAGQLYRGKVFHHHLASATGLLHFKGLHLVDKILLPKMALLLSRYGGSLDFQRPELGLDHDNESVAAFIRREFSQNILNYVAGPLISTLFFYGSHETSKLLYLLLAKHMQRLRLFTLRNGIGSLAGRLAERVVVRVNADLLDVRRNDGAFAIEDQQFSALVVAVRGDSVLKLAGLAQILAAADQAFFKNCAYHRAVMVFVATEKPVDGACYGLSIPAAEKRTAATIAFHDFMDPSKVPDSAGLLAVTGGGAEVTADQLHSDVQDIYPSAYRTTPRFVRTYEWPAAMPKFPPGRFREIAAFEGRKRTPGLFFCGDYLMGPFVESAIASGSRAADAVSRGSKRG